MSFTSILRLRFIFKIRPGHSDTLSGSGRVIRVSGYSDFEKMSHSDILKTRAGFQSDPLGSGWVWIFEKKSENYRLPIIHGSDPDI